MANSMSPNSKSYARPNEVAEFSQNFSMFSDSPVSGQFGQIKMLERFSAMQQAVFRAELMHTFNKSELQYHCNKLTKKIEQEVPNLYFKVSFHTQGDKTEKSSHIHIWGDAIPEVEEIVQKYIYEKRLTVEKNNNITYMETGKKYDVFEEEIVEKDSENKEIAKVTQEELFYEREKKEFDSLMDEISSILSEVDEILNNTDDDVLEKIDSMDDSIIDDALRLEISEDINYFLNDEDEE